MQATPATALFFIQHTLSPAPQAVPGVMVVLLALRALAVLRATQAL
jgi:hypothetical protein